MLRGFYFSRRNYIFRVKPCMSTFISYLVIKTKQNRPMNPMSCFDIVVVVFSEKSISSHGIPFHVIQFIQFDKCLASLYSLVVLIIIKSQERSPPVCNYIVVCFQKQNRSCFCSWDSYSFVSTLYAVTHLTGLATLIP